MRSSSPISDLVENEVVFRQHNENVQDALEALAQKAKEEDHALPDHSDLPLHFYCECSDENCKKRIIITPIDYKKLHKNSSQFLILPGHSVAAIERTVRQQPNYQVVEKYMTPPKKSAKLHKTDVNNA